MIRFMNAANALTLVGLSAAVACALLAADGRPALALVALIVSGVCDLFDGLIARRLTRTEEQRSFGGHLDSLVDACSFGLAPVVLLHALGLRSPLELLLLALFSACAVWRLAYFDTVGLAGGEGAARYYTGLPTTFVALIVPLGALAGTRDAATLRIACDVMAGALALAMVSPLKIRKPGGLWYAVLLAIAIALSAFYLRHDGRFPV